MKKGLFIIGIVSIMLILGLALAGCDNSTSPSGDGGGGGGGGGGGPGTPTNLRINLYMGTLLTLAWDSVSGADGYRVYDSTSSGGTYTFRISRYSTSYDIPLSTDATTWFKVTAYNSSGESAPAGPISYTP